MADTGRLQGPGTMHVENTQIYGGFVLHTGSVPTGELRVGDAVQCAVDYERRAHVAPNHTMTHVLNHALRDVLCGGVEGAAEMGGLVDQKGSLCDEQKLRCVTATDNAFRECNPAPLPPLQDNAFPLVIALSSLGVRVSPTVAATDL